MADVDPRIEQLYRERRERALLWMYQKGSNRYQHMDLRIPGTGEFSIGMDTLGDLERRGLIRGTRHHGCFELTEEGERQAKELHQNGKTWRAR